MRKLFYVPIIHMSADLGSIAKDVEKRGIAFGKTIWDKHIGAISGFWRAITDYFTSIDVKGVRVYQDGMVADGAIAEKIVEEGIKSGSKNFELIRGMIERGALLMKTEDFTLLKMERDMLVELSKAQGLAKRVVAGLRYRFSKNHLLRQRDEYIAQRIDETLKEGETGVLFIGAYHDVTALLRPDIDVVAVKDMEKIREYQGKFFLGGAEVYALSAYLASPVEIKQIERRDL